METAVIRNLRTFGQFLQKAGPYVLIEILLPGGTLVALLLYLYRRGEWKFGIELVLRVSRVAKRARGQVREIALFAQPHRIAALLRSGSNKERDGLEPLGMGPAW
jgi:hypothetical protein